MATTRKTRQPVKALNQSATEVAAAAAADKARKAASKKALKAASEGQLLREFARDRYDQDGGVMDETFDGPDFEAAIAEHGTAVKAWDAHMVTVEAKREAQAAYEVDESSHADQDAANALATAKADAATLGVPLEQMLADMGIDDQGRPLQADKQRYNGPMLALVAARKHYAKAANGILCNGDQLAMICGAHSRDETVKALGTLLFSKGLTAAVNPYLSLNPGQQSMNLRNKARHALKVGTITLADVRAAYAA